MSDMTMMQSAAFLMGMMSFLVLLVGGVLVAFRILGAREYRHNHPASNGPASAPAPASASASIEQRGRDAVQDVVLGDHQVVGLAARQDP